MIPQSHLDILISVCQMSPKIISSATVYKSSSIRGQMGYHYITQSVHWNAHSNLCTISMIYEPSGFAFQPHMRVIPLQWKDDWGWTPFLVIFFFFHASDSSENVPVHHSRACGASEGGIRGGEIMRAHTGCKEFRDSRSVGAFPLYPPSLVLQCSKDTTLTTGTRPPVTTDSQSKRRERAVIAPQQPFGFSELHNSKLTNFKKTGWELSLGQIIIVSVYQFV